MTVAEATGRDVLAVSREPAALSLWTFYHIEQRHELDALVRKSEHFDLAGLITIGAHEPSKLAVERRRFLSRVLDTSAHDRAAVARAMAHIAAHEKMKPIEITS